MMVREGREGGVLVAWGHHTLTLKYERAFAIWQMEKETMFFLPVS